MKFKDRGLKLDRFGKVAGSLVRSAGWAMSDTKARKNAEGGSRRMSPLSAFGSW
jgi:hypothetical protein